MTLCLAWRENTKVYFASDSRLTSPDKLKITDEATKVFTISVQIYGPDSLESTTTIEPLLHSSSFGMCFTGSYLNGSLLADTIEEVLSNLQGSPQISDFTIENLSEIAFSIYKQVTRQLMAIHGEGGLSQVLLGGYCPVTEEFKLYKFSPLAPIPDTPLEFSKTAINIDDGPVFIGDRPAKEKASEMKSNIAKDYTYFHILREIIKDPEILTVGGNMQAGIFHRQAFKTYGIAEYSTFENSHGMLEVKQHFKFRGLSLDLDDDELRKGNINILKPLCNPFEQERQELFKKTMEHATNRLFGTKNGSGESNENDAL